MAAKCFTQLPVLKDAVWPIRVETTHAQIEAELPYILNRSRSYLLNWDEMFGTHLRVKVSATVACSGCVYDFCDTRGGGCHECGYTGKRVDSHWVPATLADTEFTKADLKLKEPGDG